MRAQDLTASNLKAIDVGTANAIRCGATRRSSNQQQPQPGMPQGAMNNPGAATDLRRVSHRATCAPAGECATAGGVGARRQPDRQLRSADPRSGRWARTFTVNVNLTGGQNVYSVPLQIMYNPRVLQLLNVSNGTLLSQDGQTVALVNRDDSMAGILQVTASRPPGTSGISGDGSVFTLTFQARAPGQSTLSINRANLKNATMQNTPASGSQAIVTVH